MNRVEISGRLTRSPEIRYVGDARFPIASMNVAVDDGTGRFNRDSKKTEYGSGFYKVEVTGAYGEYLVSVLDKGDEVHVVGSLSQFTRQGRDGGESTTHTSIKASVVHMLFPPRMPRQVTAPQEPLTDGWDLPPGGDAGGF